MQWVVLVVVVGEEALIRAAVADTDPTVGGGRVGSLPTKLSAATSALRVGCSQSRSLVGGEMRLASVCSERSRIVVFRPPPCAGPVGRQ